MLLKDVFRLVFHYIENPLCIVVLIIPTRKTTKCHNELSELVLWKHVGPAGDREG